MVQPTDRPSRVSNPVPQPIDPMPHVDRLTLCRLTSHPCLLGPSDLVSLDLTPLPRLLHASPTDEHRFLLCLALPHHRRAPLPPLSIASPTHAPTSFAPRLPHTAERPCPTLTPCLTK
jgi:hypothetical protein